MTTNTEVRFYSSSMSGVSTIGNTAGSLITVLDACLVNGFGSVTLDSLVIASNVATGTISTGHNFTMMGNTGPVITIAGATPSGLNGNWRIQTIPGTTTFTFTTSGISDQTATGTITAKRAAAGFSKAFSGTNKAAYCSDDITGNRLYLRIDDSNTTYCRVRGYETMSDVDTGTGLFPTDTQLSGGGYIYKASSTGRSWILVSDGKIIYCLLDTTGSANWNGGFVFGDIDSFKSPDVYSTVLICSGSSSGRMQLYLLGDSTNSYLARSHSQLGTCIVGRRYSHGRATYLGVSGQDYPAPADNSVHLWPVDCWEDNTLARGLMPGLWNPIHNNNVPHETVFDDIPALPGRTLINFKTANDVSGSDPSVVFDMTGPWR